MILCSSSSFLIGTFFSFFKYLLLFAPSLRVLALGNFRFSLLLGDIYFFSVVILSKEPKNFILIKKCRYLLWTCLLYTFSIPPRARMAELGIILLGADLMESNERTYVNAILVSEKSTFFAEFGRLLADSCQFYMSLIRISLFRFLPPILAFSEWPMNCSSSIIKLIMEVLS